MKQTKPVAEPPSVAPAIPFRRFCTYKTRSLSLNHAHWQAVTATPVPSHGTPLFPQRSAAILRPRVNFSSHSFKLLPSLGLGPYTQSNRKKRTRHKLTDRHGNSQAPGPSPGESTPFCRASVAHRLQPQGSPAPPRPPDRCPLPAPPMALRPAKEEAFFSAISRKMLSVAASGKCCL